MAVSTVAFLRAASLLQRSEDPYLCSARSLWWLPVSYVFGGENADNNF